MNNKFINLFLLFFITSITNLGYSQSWRFPNCGDYQVTNIEFIDIQHDSLLITVYSDCDSCYQYAYVGLIAYGGGDTLAMTECLTCLPSPDNKSTWDYYLLTKKNFEINGINRIQMTYGGCDSIPFSSILHIADYKNLNSYKLYQNFPNPFNPETKIEFEIAQSAETKLSIYTVNGQLIKKLVNQRFASGKHTITWNGTNQIGEKVSSGLYIYQIVSENFSESKKLILLK